MAPGLGKWQVAYAPNNPAVTRLMNKFSEQVSVTLQGKWRLVRINQLTVLTLGEKSHYLYQLTTMLSTSKNVLFHEMLTKGAQSLQIQESTSTLDQHQGQLSSANWSLFSHFLS